MTRMRKRLLLLSLCVGVVQVMGYYVAGIIAGNGSMACPQPDTMLYCQAARRIVEGAPFSFSVGSAVCTGTTSVLYPFVLAIPYVIGATGSALLMAGFWLNAAFYLLGLLGWVTAACEWLGKPSARLVAALLIPLSGSYAYTALSQCDLGLWLACSGLMAAALALKKPLAYGFLFVLAPWIRPEGMVCVMAFGMIVGLGWLGGRFLHLKGTQPCPADWIVSILGVFSVICVFSLNYVLTGDAQFSSVAHKGYFKTLPFAQAFHAQVMDLVGIAKELVFGLPINVPRCFYTIPFLGAVAFWLGVCRHNWRQEGVWRQYALCLAVAGGILTVAQSGWQGSNMDRYICWTLPFFAIFTAEGAIELGKRVVRFCPTTFPACLFLLYGTATSLALLFVFNLCGSECDRTRAFAKACDELMPPGASIGSVGDSGLIYDMQPRHFVHVSGIYSPEITGRSYVERLELFKNKPELRFDYWLSGVADASLLGEEVVKAIGKDVLTGPNGCVFKKVCWDALEPHAPSVPGRVLQARVDLGHAEDEQAADYQPIMRYGLQPFKPFLQVGKLGKVTQIEGGRVLFGGDAMTVPLKPGKEVTVVMRTYPHQEVSYGNGIANHKSLYAFANPLKMRLSVDDQIVGEVEVAYGETGFSDVSFTIPGSAITQSPCRIAFLGDHIACGYWFFQ